MLSEEPAQLSASVTDHDLLWGIGAVAERLEIAPSTLRTWDRRYGIGPSKRTDGGHRRYDEDDIRRVRVMLRLTGRGVPAQTAARVAVAMESGALERALSTPLTDPGDLIDISAAPVTVPSILAAALALDADALTLMYQRVLRENDLVTAWNDLLAPALREIGAAWGQGSLGIESEHLASELLVTELRSQTAANRRLILHGRHVVLASADEDQHYLPLLALEAELARNGVGALFLGPRVPVASLARILQQTKTPMVFLWASMQRPEHDDLWETLNDVTWPLTLLLGGPGWDAQQATSPYVTVRHSPSLQDAAQALTAGAVGSSGS